MSSHTDYTDKTVTVGEVVSWERTFTLEEVRCEVTVVTVTAEAKYTRLAVQWECRNGLGQVEMTGSGRGVVVPETMPDA